MAWLLLVVAGLLEVGWAIAMRRSLGFTRLGPSLVTGVLLVASVWLLSVAARSLPLGTAYAVWVGIGAAGAAAAGALLFGEGMSRPQAACLALLILAIVGLKVTTPAGGA